jgi:hypothetical protein
VDLGVLYPAQALRQHIGRDRLPLGPFRYRGIKLSASELKVSAMRPFTVSPSANAAAPHYARPALASAAQLFSEHLANGYADQKRKNDGSEWLAAHTLL